jgi:hypothetical protein
VALIIEVKVATQSGKHSICLDKSGSLKCFVKAAPEDGKANKEVIEVISDAIGVTKRSIEIISGLISRKKKLAIQTDLTYEQFLIKIGCGVQKKMF